jgi:hypothetical protein
MHSAASTGAISCISVAEAHPAKDSKGSSPSSYVSGVVSRGWQDTSLLRHTNQAANHR